MVSFNIFLILHQGYITQENSICPKFVNNKFYYTMEKGSNPLKKQLKSLKVKLTMFIIIFLKIKYDALLQISFLLNLTRFLGKIAELKEPVE